MTGLGEITRIGPRSCGGWIGIFDDGSLRFGVTAPSEAEARRELTEALGRWRAVAGGATSTATATGAACL